MIADSNLMIYGPRSSRGRILTSSSAPNKTNLQGMDEVRGIVVETSLYKLIDLANLIA